jgi:molybdopterin molybdotransferase
VIGLEEAKEFVLRDVVALEVTEVALEEALGCVVAHDVLATEQVPSFRNSSMDGFTFRAVDTKVGATRLRIIDSVMAGHVSSLVVGPGEAMRIMTGAALPEGADTVCRIEDVTVVGDVVEIPRAFSVGECVRHPGDDVSVGQVVVPARTELTPPALAVLAGQGFSSVHVHRRPVVGVLSTGDELARGSEALAPGQIRDLNRPLLLALLRASGMTAVDLGVVRDDAGEIALRIKEGALACDALISTGGVSVGDVDHVKSVIAELSDGRARSMQIAMKPAKPFAFGSVGDSLTPVFGLPGNPVSTRVSFEVLVRPALRALAGHQSIERPRMSAILDLKLPAPDDGKTHFVHVSANVQSDGRLHVVDSARHQSHLMSAIVACNAIAVLKEGESYGVGECVELMIVNFDAVALV